jgi:hypothetical protein
MTLRTGRDPDARRGASARPGAAPQPVGAEEFVRACLRLRQAPGELGAARAAAAAVANWQAVLALARAERVAPLLAAVLRGQAIAPPEIEAALRTEYRITAVSNLLLQRELAICLRACAEAEVAVIVLKGAALAEPVYRNLALRPMCDVDLLVDASDRERARQVLEGVGFALLSSEARPGALAAYECEMALGKSTGPQAAVIDLHWSLFDSPHYQRRVDMDWFWHTAEAREIAQAPARVLGLEAQILHLCGHLALHHAGRGLLWWQDLAELLTATAGRLDWRELLTRARRYDLQLAVQRVVLELAERRLAPIPSDALAAVRAVRPSRDEAWVFERLHGAQPPAGRRLWIDLASMPTWAERARFAVSSLFPSTAYMRRRYGIRHPLLVPFYYPWRWLRGLRGLR